MAHEAEYAELRERVELLEHALGNEYQHVAVADIDKILRIIHDLRSDLVTENRRRQDALMAELDAKYGPVT